MKFEKIDRYHWKIDVGDGNIEEILLAAARASYETAPVVLGHTDHDNYNRDFREYIHGGEDTPHRSLSMSMVEGRNCQTYIFRNGEEYWFNAHNFSERANLSGGTYEGARTIVTEPEQFLDRVLSYVSIDDMLNGL
jgi:hypothetical protein